MALHRGRIFNTAGDAILAEFGSAVEAVRCATEIQAALRTRNDQLPEERRVQFRIGVNLGDVMVEGGDLLGDGVNVAARLQAAAEPGGICIAGSVYEQIRNKLSLSFKPLGEMNYKNIPQPVRTFAIAEADGIGPLPSPAQRQQTTAARSRFWAAVIAVVLLLAGGAAVWGYSDYRYRQAEAERAAAFAAESRAAEEARRRSEAEAAKAAQQQAAQQQAQAERRRIEDEARRLIEAKRRQPDPHSLPPPSRYRCGSRRRPARLWSRQLCPAAAPPLTPRGFIAARFAMARSMPSRPAAIGRRPSSQGTEYRVSGRAGRQG